MPLPHFTIKKTERRTYGGNSSTPSAHHHRKKRKKNQWVRLGIWTSVCGLVGISLIGTIATAWVSRDLPDPNKLTDRTIAESTKIFDRTGEHLLYEIYTDKKRTLIELSDIPEHAKWAAIMVEDKNFYTHRGFNLRGIFRAIVVNTIRGGKTQGGSTITQQFVKNAILSPEKTYTRKLKELLLSYKIEKTFTKDQILKLYFNEIPYGSTNYGIESASQTYFGKSARDLNIAEAATLAALPQAPTKYLNNPDVLLGRRNYIIDLLLKEEHISKEAAEAAKKEPLNLKERLTDIQAPHFVLYVKELLTELFGERAVEQEGLEVITTLDFEKQELAEKAVAEGAEKNEKKFQAKNAALVSLDARTGEILAMVGSRDYFADEYDGQVNVTIRPRQPGSSFKPIVYAAGFEKGYTLDTILYDVITSFKTETGQTYEPKNYDLKEHGPVTARQALAGSLNIPAVKMIYLTGISRVLDLADALGYTTLKDRGRFGLSLVLGGGEVKLLEHANAFATFAREGTFIPTTALLKVKNRSGEELFSFTKESGKEVMSKDSARIISDILSDDSARSFVFGTSGPLTLPGRKVAAKTGTTNDYRDAWTIGYTPSIVTGVWVGNNNNSEMKRGADGSVVAAPIWNTYMKETLTGTPVESFGPLPPNTADKPVLKGGSGGKITLAIDILSGKLATSSTPPEFIQEKTFIQPYPILHYLQKDDPRGPVPERPEDDPYYIPWKQAIEDWAKKNDISFEEIPSETDAGHDPFYTPKITFTNPPENFTFTNRDINGAVDIQAPLEVAKVEFLIDGILVAKDIEKPFGFSYHARELSKGFHTLIARAYDVNGNLGAESIDFNLNAPPDPPDVVWISPKAGSSFYLSSFPLSIEVGWFQKEDIKQVRIFAQKEGSERNLITTLVPNTNNETNFFKWKNPPGAGRFIFEVEVEDTAGVLSSGTPLPLTLEQK